MTRGPLLPGMTTRRGDREPPTRRAVLAGTGALTLSALAGCLRGSGAGGTDGDAAGGSPTAGGSSDDVTTTEETQTLENHPAAAGLADQPYRGPDPFEAEAVIVDFSDPSCPTCRRFEEDVVPRITSELVDPGRAAFVFRVYPVIYPWGEPATQALESTYARDEDAFWSLKDFYYAEQSSFDETNVLSRTREHLAAETNLDADAVVDDAEAKAHDAAVQSDLTAGMEAGAGRTTPHLFLFRDGEFRTKAAGSVSYSVIENALGL